MSRKRAGQPITLSVGAVDPTGGSGLVADWNVLARFRTHPLVVASAVKLVGTDPEPIEPALLRRQLKAYVEGQQVSVAKTGLLLTRDNIEVVANLFEEPSMAPEKVVVDAALESDDEMMMVTSAVVSLLKMRLLGLAHVFVAYMSEAERISGTPVQSIDGMKESAEAIHMFGAKYVLVRADKIVDDEWLDILYDGKEHQFLFRRMSVPAAFRRRRDIFASVLAAGLAHGMEPKNAVENAQEFEVSDSVSRLVG